MTAARRGTGAVLSPASGLEAAREGSASSRAENLARPESTLRRGAAAVVVVSCLALAYGVLLRVWLLVHLPLFGDEAVVGLMARAVDDGHFSAFYWGQRYGGLEAYPAAVTIALGGGAVQALNAAAAVLSAVAAALVGGVVLVATKNRLLALAAAAGVFVWPYVVVWQSVRELGFREATLCCGLLALLCCMRVARGQVGATTFVVLGLAVGLGWWASPEILYFALPCLVLLAGWWRRTPGPPRDMRSAEETAPTRRSAVVLLAAGAVVGSLPWWYANAHTGFASLQRSSLPQNGGVTYWSKLSVFFRDMLPMQLGLRAVASGNWLGGPLVGRVLYVVALALVVTALAGAGWRALALRRDALAAAALGVAVGTYPFLYAAAPGTDYWLDGRYGVYLPSLLVLLFAVVAEPLRPPGRRAGDRRRSTVSRALLGSAVAVAVALVLTVAGAHDQGVPASPAFFSGWRSGDSPMQQVVEHMRAHHITAAYGDYWTAYDLDFLSGGSPVVSPSVLDVNRSTGIAAAVATSADPAWLFFAPRRTAEAATVFSNPQPGPGPYTEQAFEARLQQRGVPYAVVPLGVLDAVVPARRIVVP